MCLRQYNHVIGRRKSMLLSASPPYEDITKLLVNQLHPAAYYTTAYLALRWSGMRMKGKD